MRAPASRLPTITGTPQSTDKSARRKRDRLATVVWLLILLGCGYLFYYYFLPRSVMGFHVTRSHAGMEITGPGLLDARNKVTITTRIQGYLKAINVDRNDSVIVGQILAQQE